jgi:hypothetical protein
MGLAICGIYGVEYVYVLRMAPKTGASTKYTSAHEVLGRACKEFSVNSMPSVIE